MCSASALTLRSGGGACQTQEKLVAAAADVFVIVADHRKESSVLGTSWQKGVPLEVIPEGHVTVANAIKKLGGTPKLRMGKAKAGPVITDNGGCLRVCCWARTLAKACIQRCLQETLSLMLTWAR